MRDGRSIARKVGSVALAGALAATGALGIVGAQAAAPAGTGVLQQAQAKTYNASKTGSYQFAIGKQSLKSAKFGKSAITLKLKTATHMYYMKGDDVFKKLTKGTYVLKLGKKVKCTICRGTKEKKVSLSKLTTRMRQLSKRKTDANTNVQFSIKKGKVVEAYMFDCEPK